MRIFILQPVGLDSVKRFFLHQKVFFFTVLYFNVSSASLPFEEFMISLISVDGIQSCNRRVIGETKAEFRPCSKLASINESTSVSTDCYQLVNGQYMTRVRNISTVQRLFRNLRVTHCFKLFRLILSIRDAIFRNKLSLLLNDHVGDTYLRILPSFQVGFFQIRLIYIFVWLTYPLFVVGVKQIGLEERGQMRWKTTVV